MVNENEKELKMKICVYNIGEGNTELLVKKINWWLKEGAQIRVVCPKWVKKDFIEMGLTRVEYVVVPLCRRAKSKLLLIPELIKRTIIASIITKRIFRETEVIYSISSVLDEVFLPFWVRRINRKIRWVVLFENEVFIQREGGVVIRVLAYIFYQISLVLIKYADYVYTINSNLKEVLIQRGFDEKKIVVTGNAVDCKMIGRYIGKNEKRFDLLYMGRIDENKGIFDLVEIMKIIRKKYPEVKMRIAGSGPSDVRKKLIDRIKKARLSNSIQLMGYTKGEEKYRLLVKSKVFVFPSKYESYGVALLEAVCSGQWAVVYDLEVYRDIYRNGEIETVEKGRIVQMAKKAMELLGRKDVNRKGLLLCESRKFSYRELALVEYEVMKKLI